MTYWIQWHEADGKKGRRSGPFLHREDAVRHIEQNMQALATSLESWTGEAGLWMWVTENAATLWRDDMFHDDELQGYFTIEQVAPEDESEESDPGNA